MRRVLPAFLLLLTLCASLRLGGAVWVRTANYTYDSAGNRIQQIYQATMPEPGNTTNAPYITTNTTYSYIQVGRDNFLTVANLTTGWWKSGSNKLQQVAEYSAFSYDDQGRRQFEDRYDYYDYDTDGGHTGYGAIGGNYSGTYYSYNEPVTVKLHDGVSPVRAYTLTASSTGNTGNLSVPAEDWLRGSDWGGGIGGILYSQVEFGNATTASYYHYDGRGDVVALTSNTGNVTYAAAYNAYGTHATVTASNVTTTGTQEVGTDTDPFRTNTREEWDSADGTAFVKEGHRIRGLETDTYLTRDPLGQAAGTNYYTYVLQDEWTKTDPLGEETEDQYDQDAANAQKEATRKDYQIQQSYQNGEYGDPKGPEAQAKAATLTQDENAQRDSRVTADEQGKANLQSTAKWARDHNIAVDESTLDDDPGHSSAVGPTMSSLLGVDSPRDPATAGQAQYASIRESITKAGAEEVVKQAAAAMMPGGGEEEIAAEGGGALARAISSQQKNALRELFGTGEKGAADALANLQAGGSIPEGLSRETLETYRKIAQQAIDAGKDANGAQAARLKVIDSAIQQAK